jgi:hypothetical protein
VRAGRARVRQVVKTGRPTVEATAPISVRITRIVASASMYAHMERRAEMGGARHQMVAKRDWSDAGDIAPTSFRIRPIVVHAEMSALTAHATTATACLDAGRAGLSEEETAARALSIAASTSNRIPTTAAPAGINALEESVSTAPVLLQSNRALQFLRS